MKLLSRMFKLLRFSKITQPFLQLVNRQVDEDIFKSPAFKGGKKWLTMKRSHDPENPEDDGFFFVERLGKDSVAFLLWDGNQPEAPFMILHQYSSPYARFLQGAFTGSLEKPDVDLKQHLIEEAKEEAGFTVDTDRIIYLGKEQVGSSTNEEVHLFLIDITGMEQEVKEPENIFEENMDRRFLSSKDIFNPDQHIEWKAKLIVILSLIFFKKESLEAE
ncbi:MAG TPA: hypothetical protein ENI23_17700 [bacterium]|nr:hypothetical protein [bacterium]